MCNSYENYYRETADESTSCPVLNGSGKADVCIVGAGMAGLTAGLRLAQSGKKVVVLDANKIAWGASGRNGGAVGPGYSASFSKIASYSGYENAKKLFELSVEGVDIIRNNIKSLDIESSNLVSGRLQASRISNSDDAKKVVQWAENEFGYKLKYMSRNDLQSELHTDKYFHAVYDPNAFHFHPLNYATGLAKEIRRLKGDIFEQTRAVSLDKKGSDWAVSTEYGEIESPHVLIACGGYTDRLVPRLMRSYVPISTYMVSTGVQPDLIATAIESQCAIGDDRRSSDYYRLVENGNRLLWGGMITTKQSEPSRLGRMLRQRIIDVYPQLLEIKIEQSWSGRMAYAKHLMPQIGSLENGLWYCTGFGGHGMNTTAIGGTVIAEAIAGESDRYRLFSPFGLDWSGGFMGKVAVQSFYWGYRIFDFVQERKSRSNS